MGWSRSRSGAASASRRWGGGAVSGKQFVLAAMIGTLALVAIACSVAVVLSPGHIFFSARVRVFYDRSGGRNNPYLNITIVANNTSKHARVSYTSMKTEVWLTDGEWIPVDFDNITSVGFSSHTYWPPANSTKLSAQMKVAERNALKEKDQGNDKPKPNENKINGYFTVVIKTQVRFMYSSFARTRLYDIHVTCPSSDLTTIDDNPSGTSTSTDHDQGRQLNFSFMSINNVCT